MESASNFDIAIVDLILHDDRQGPSEPYVGLSLVEQLKEAAPDLPIMVLTVVSDPKVHRRLKNLGVPVMRKGALRASEVCEKVREIVKQLKNK
jgi:DNA-binding NarL/FixJ family response regulator